MLLVQMVVLAADAGTGTDIAGNLLTYGPLGIFAALMVVVLRTLLKREGDRSDRYEAEVIRLNAQIQEKMVPALLQATEVVKGAQSLLERMEYQRKLETEASQLVAAQLAAQQQQRKNAGLPPGQEGGF